MKYEYLSCQVFTLSSPRKKDKSKNTQPKTEYNEENFKRLQNMLKEILNEFSERDRNVLIMRFGLDKNESHSIKEVCDFFNISRTEIRQIEAKALRLLNDEK